MQFIFIGLAALAAGLVNALAGGGTLISFPVLVALGFPAVVANVTNTVALCPGYLGGTLAQKADLRGQRRRLLLFVPAGAAGGFAGGLLLLHTGEKQFRELVPFLILAAAGLLAAQDPVRAWLGRRTGAARDIHPGTALFPVAAAAVYGGYFGAGLSVILLAALGLLLEDSLTRLNALKQAVAFSANVAAAVVFIASGRVAWVTAMVMAAAALLGGALGGRLAGRIRPSTLRRVVVALGIVVGAIYLLRR